MTGALHFVLQFVEQPTERRRMLFGARAIDRSIIRAAEVGVQEAPQFDGRALKWGRAPCEAPPRHSVVFLFHSFRSFLVLLSSVAWRRMEFERRNYLVAVITRLASRPASQPSQAPLLIVGYAGCRSRIQSTKNPPASSGGGKFRGDFSFGRSFSPHIDLCRPRHLAVSNGRVAGFVYRITPDASNI